MVIKYRMKDDLCVTPCPRRLSKGKWRIRVASIACAACRYYRSDNKHSVECARPLKKVVAVRFASANKRSRKRVSKVVRRTASDSSAMDAIAAIADNWCDATNQPNNICVALYQFTKWARQQHQQRGRRPLKKPKGGDINAKV
jgi:hypothetical protein